MIKVRGIVLSLAAAALLLTPGSVLAFSTVLAPARSSAPVHAKRAPAHVTRKKAKRRCEAVKRRGTDAKRARAARCKAPVKAAKLRPHTTVKRSASVAKAAAAKKTTTRKPTTKKPTTTTTTTTTATTTTATTTTATTTTTPTATTTSAPSTGASSASSGAQSGSTWPVASHIQTWSLDDCGQGSSTSPALVRQWLSYAEANCGPGWDAKALSDCHFDGTTVCDVIQYLDTNWIYLNGSPPWNAFHAAAAESWYQHTPGSSTNRVMSSGYGGGYLINQSNPAVQSFFQNYVRSNYPAEDGLMMDDQSPGLNIQLYYSTCGCTSTDEVASSAALRATHEAMSAAMTHASGQPYIQIDNTLPANPYLPQGLDMLNDSSGVHGLLKEGSPEYDGTLDPYYSTLLDEIAYVADNTDDFVVTLSYGAAGASYQQQSRRVQEATMLLGFSPGHLVDWADLDQNTDDLSVWPEEGIYPTAPVQSMGAPGGNGCLAGTGSVCSTGGHNDLQVEPGVYRREFSACYNQGAPIGPCAAIVNTTASPVTVSPGWLTQSYGHQITFNGGDVQSGGTVNLAGAGFTAGVTTVGAQDAILLGQ